MNHETDPLTLQAESMMAHFEGYLEQHPEVAVIDRLPNVRKLLDRSISYSVINSSDLGNIGKTNNNLCQTPSLKIWLFRCFHPHICGIDFQQR
jgi:hypothetical protein